MQLAIPTQMGNHHRRLFFHLHLPRLLRHGRARNLPSRLRLGRQKQRRHRYDDVGLYLGIQSVILYCLPMKDPASQNSNSGIYIAFGPLVSSPTIYTYLHVHFKSKVLGPLSEIFGRSLVLQLSNLFYFGMLCNRSSFFLSDDKIVCSLESRMWVCDFAGSIYCISASCWVRWKCSVVRAFPLRDSLEHWTYLDLSHYEYTQIGGAVMGDLFNAEERGKALALYSLAPLLGPALGPVCGAWYLHFQWRHSG